MPFFANPPMFCQGHGISSSSPVRGHDRSTFGRGQIITRTQQAVSDGSVRAVLIAGSDPRGDGAAMGY